MPVRRGPHHDRRPGHRGLSSPRRPQGGRVYIIGGRGLHEAVLDESGGLFTLDDRRPDFVLVGLDLDFTYEKMKRGCLAIRAGARFIASNPDTTFPTEEGIVPGAGSLVAALEACTSVKPTVIGKPEQVAFDLALERLGADRRATAMLGDRLDTDILGGIRAGLTTIMVMTGVSTAEELAAAPVQARLRLPGPAGADAAFGAVAASGHLPASSSRACRCPGRKRRRGPGQTRPEECCRDRRSW